MRKTLELNEADEALLAVVVEHMESMALIKPRKGRDVQTTKPFRLLLKMYHDIYIDGNQKIAGDSTNLVLKELAEMQKKLSAIQIDSAQTRFDSAQNLALALKTNSAIQQIQLDTKSVGDSLNPVLLATNVATNIQSDLDKMLSSKMQMVNLGLRNLELAINRESELGTSINNYVAALGDAIKNQGQSIPIQVIEQVNRYTKKMILASTNFSFGVLIEKIESVLLLVKASSTIGDSEKNEKQLRGIFMMNKVLNIFKHQLSAVDVAKSDVEIDEILVKSRARNLQKKYPELYQKIAAEE